MISIAKLKSLDERPDWKSYVVSHPNSTLYHLSNWKNVIENAYGHKTYYLMALDKSSNAITGILPLTHFKHYFFGNSLVSVPFFDTGGILADNCGIERSLLSEAIKLGIELRSDNIELRQTKSLSWLEDFTKQAPISDNMALIRPYTRSDKVRMIIDLPDTSEEFMGSLKSKVRSQIKRPIKEGLIVKVGGVELIDDFYKVFIVNMRDLGSPVHSKRIMKEVLNEFHEKSKVFVVYRKRLPIACSIVVEFNKTLYNPWASFLREYSKISPNMLLYWKMIEFACHTGCRRFDFGRSTVGEGTYRFKEQWGAKPEKLYWHVISINGIPIERIKVDKSRYDTAINYWRKLPVSVTRIIGPKIRKHIWL